TVLAGGRDLGLCGSRSPRMTAVAEPAVVVPPAAPSRDRWLAAGFVAPAVLILVTLFVLPLVLLLAGSVLTGAGGSFGEYAKLLGPPFYLGVIWNSLRLALLTTLIALAIGYP